MRSYGILSRSSNKETARRWMLDKNEGNILLQALGGALFFIVIAAGIIGLVVYGLPVLEEIGRQLMVQMPSMEMWYRGFGQ